MTTVWRTEIALGVIAIFMFQMAFRPITLNAFASPLRLVTASPAITSVSPAYSAALVFTSVVAFEMAPADDSVGAHGTGVYTVSGNIAHLSIRLTDLKPDTAYAIQCGNEPCSQDYPMLTADGEGRAFWNVDRTPFNEGVSVAETLVVVARIDKKGNINPELSYMVISYPH